MQFDYFYPKQADGMPFIVFPDDYLQTAILKSYSRSKDIVWSDVGARVIIFKKYVD